DLLLYVPLPTGPGEMTRFLVVNQVRPNTGQTLFPDDVVGRSRDAIQRPAVAEAARTGHMVETEVDSIESVDRIRVTAVPVAFRGKVVAVVARESSLSLNRQLGELEHIYLETFDRLANMIVAGEFPFPDEEVLAAGGPRVGDGSILLDDQGRIVFGSPNAVSALRRLGVRGRIEQQSLADLGAESSATYRAFFSARPAAEEIERDEACIVLRCIPLISDGRVDGALVLIHDISELRSRDRLLVSKDATIKEIHHRVKNNLQTISSLLRLQGRRLTEPSAKAAIEESVRRIRSIALVHEVLSREDGDEVELGEILRPLTRMVEEGLTSPDRPLRVLISGDAGKLPSPVATSLAVILAELLQNVVDHAYPPAKFDGPAAGEVKVDLARRVGFIDIVVADDGVGMDEPHTQTKSTSLGLSIVTGLVSELGGTITFGPTRSGVHGGPGPNPLSSPKGRGTRVKLTIPVTLAP
ncbi:MAG TPA: PAS domain-containing sensor histidine kinase, partial [Microthrixaceae bacterium]|nr:PAS domain-containing sensor histidine kinase [Microthrixaceae bacterium]